MKITLADIGKKYNRDWIFRHVDFEFENHKTYALTGNNGSGKSTLLQVIYAFQTSSEGTISYEIDAQKIEEENLHKHVAFAAPYLELMEEFTLMEMLEFHFSFKPCIKGISFDEIIKNCGLDGNQNKAIKFFSSGMKQRIKLILAFYSDTPLLLLDEPCTNFDDKGINWYRSLLLSQHHKRTILISSNQSNEYDMADGILHVDNFKKQVMK